MILSSTSESHGPTISKEDNTGMYAVLDYTPGRIIHTTLASINVIDGVSSAVTGAAAATTNASLLRQTWHTQ